MPTPYPKTDWIMLENGSTMTKFNVASSIPILERTPSLLKMWLENLDDFWIRNNEGEDTWSPYDILGHLIHGEKTDWIQRLHIILGNSTDRTFAPFDRFAQFEDSKGKSLDDLLTEFSNLRAKNIKILNSMSITEEHYGRKAIHPSLGEVSLSELLAAWVTHDLGHIGQIARVMAKQYKDEVGPWQEYLSILHR